jgi:tetratricopeptide (TPR) repeat protein
VTGKYTRLFFCLWLFQIAMSPSVIIAEVEEETTLLASSEEVYFLQRITEFLKDKDYILAANQIEEFFQTFPNSEFTDRLLVLQGDLYSAESKYLQALGCYEKLQNPEFKDKSLSNRLAALLQLKRYSTLVQETRNFLSAHTNSPLREAALFYQGQAHLALAENDKLNRNQIYIEAQKAFEQLRDSPYSLFALTELIKIYEEQNLVEDQGNCYLLLAKKFPDKREQFLFAAAQCQKKYSSESALKTYLEVRHLRGPLTAQANIERLVLLFELQRYQDITNETEEFQQWNRTTEGPLAPLLIGRSFYHLGHYEDAITSLEPILKDLKTQQSLTPASNDTSLIKSILLPLIVSAHFLNKEELKEQWLNDYATIVGDNQIWKYLTKASLQSLEKAQAEKLIPLTHFHEDVVNTLEKALAIEAIPKAQQPGSLVKIGESLYALGRYDEVIAKLSDFSTHYAEDPRLYHVHLLLAGSYDNISDPNKFIEHAETVLALKHDIAERQQLQKNLFVSYLKLGQQAESESEQEIAFQKAVGYLYANAQEMHPETKDQLLWLANLSEEIASWNRRARIFYYLGMQYQVTEQSELALEAYHKAITQKGEPAIVSAAKLAEARLLYRMATPENRSLTNPKMLSILKTLKDLQIRKMASQEPTHLEAALEYAFIRSSLEPKELQLEQYHLLLERAKAEFTTQDDIPSKEYHRLLQENKAKSALHKAYIQLIEGHLSLTEAKIDFAKGNLTDATTKGKLALSIFEGLLKENLGTTKYLLNSAQLASKEAATL